MSPRCVQDGPVGVSEEQEGSIAILESSLPEGGGSREEYYLKAEEPDLPRIDGQQCGGEGAIPGEAEPLGSSAEVRAEPDLNLALAVDVRAVLSCALPSMEFSEQQMEHFDQALHDRELERRTRARALIRLAISAEGQETLRALRDDEGLSFDRFVKESGPLSAIAMIALAKENDAVRSILKNNRHALSILAARLESGLLDSLVRRNSKGESVQRALYSPEYLGRISSRQADDLFRIFVPILTEERIRPITLPSSKALLELTELSLEEMESLHSLAAGLKERSGRGLGSWEDLCGLLSLQREGVSLENALDLFEERAEADSLEEEPVVADNGTLEMMPSDPLMPFIYDSLASAVPLLVEGKMIIDAKEIAQALTPAQRRLLGDHTGLPDDAPSRQTVEQARSFFRAALIMTRGSPGAFDDHRYPLEEDTIRVGPALLRLLNSGLRNEELIDPSGSFVCLMRIHENPELARVPFSQVEREQRRAHFYAVIQSEDFLHFVETAWSAGIDMIEDVGPLWEIDPNSTTRGFKNPGLYTAYRLYELDRANDQVLTRLLQLGLRVDPQLVKSLALHDFVTWPELQQAVTSKDVASFLRADRDDFSSILPHDLVVINERILPLLREEQTREFFEGGEYDGILARLKGERSEILPQHLRYNYQRMVPSILASILELHSKGFDFEEALDAGERLAEMTGYPARPNDAIIWLQRSVDPLIERVFSDLQGVEAELDQRLEPVYQREIASGRYNFSSKEQRRQFTRPELQYMHPVTKIKIGVLVESLEREDFVRELKLLALKSWERECPFILEIGEQDEIVLAEEVNLMGEEGGRTAVVGYDTIDLRLALLQAHTHPSVFDSRPTRYSNVPSGMDFEAGDLEAARYSRGGMALSIVNNREIFREMRDEGLTIDEVQARAERDPEFLDKIKINLDFYYLDVPHHRKSNLDLGVY